MLGYFGSGIFGQSKYVDTFCSYLSVFSKSIIAYLQHLFNSSTQYKHSSLNIPHPLKFPWFSNKFTYFMMFLVLVTLIRLSYFVTWNVLKGQKDQLEWSKDQKMNDLKK